MLGLIMGLLILFGFKREGLSIMNYSLGLVLVHGAIAAETVILYALSRVLRGKRTHYLLILAGLLLGGSILSQIVPALQQVSNQALDLIFGYSAFSIGVQETLPWSFSGAYDAINVAILLVAGGFLVLGYRLIKKPDRALIFVAVWSVVMLLLTIQFQRFLYYFTVNIALLCALCITEPFRWDLDSALQRIPWGFMKDTGNGGWEPLSEKTAGPEKPAKKKKAIPAARNTAGMTGALKIACLIAICILTVTHIGLSLSQDIQLCGKCQ